jgi:hypothetical protein
MRMIATIIKEYRDKNNIIIFMDNISIYSDSKEMHEVWVRAVRAILWKLNFKLKNPIYQFRHQRIEFVSYKVYRQGNRLLDYKIMLIAN